MSLSDDFRIIDHTRLCWDTSSKLGEGSFGIVYRGEYDANPVAIKVIKRPRSESVTAPVGDRAHLTAALRQHRREIDRYQVVRNPYIILYHGSFRGDDPRDLFIVTEYLEGGSLYESLTCMRHREAVLDEFSFLTIASHIARGLLHVHNQKFTHGDIKPQNVLLTSAIQLESRPTLGCKAFLPPNSIAKIADFGLSKRLEGAIPTNIFGSSAATADFGTGAVGTYLYMSPEAYAGIANISDDAAKASDLYAYGLVLFELLSGLQSWALENVTNVFQLSLLVQGGSRPSWGPRKDQIDARYIQLVEQCWSQNAQDRPSIQQVVDRVDELLKSYKQKISTSTPDSVPAVQAQRDSGVISSSDSSSASDDQHSPGHPNSSRTSKTQAPKLPRMQYEPVELYNIPNNLGDSSGSESSSGGTESEGGSLEGSGSGTQKTRVDTSSENNLKQPASISYDEGLSRNNIPEDTQTEDQILDLLAPPGLVHVISTKLTISQVENGRRRFRRNGEYHTDSNAASEDNSRDSDASINANISSLRLGKLEAESVDQTDDVDFNVGKVVDLKHVKSTRIAAPKVDGLQIPSMNDDRKPVLGLGSIANGAPDGSPHRSNTEMLNSFASPMSGAKVVESKPAEECDSNEWEKFSKLLQGEDTHKPDVEHTKVEMEKVGAGAEVKGAEQFPSINISAVIAETLPGFPKMHRLPPLHTSTSTSKETTPEAPERHDIPEEKQPNLYASPENIEIEPKVLSELEQNDKFAFDASTSNTQSVMYDNAGKMAPVQTGSSDYGQFPSFPPRPPSNPTTNQLPHRENFANQQSGWNYPSQSDAQIESRPNEKPIRPSMSHPEMPISYRIPPYAPQVANVHHPTAYGKFANPAVTGIPTSTAYTSLTSQGASAPPLSDTFQSAVGGTSTHQGINARIAPNISSPWHGVGGSQPIPSAQLYPYAIGKDGKIATPNLHPSVHGLVYALRRNDGMAVAEELWRHGNRRWVAEALALSPSLGGEAIMSCATRYLAVNNELPADRKDAHIAVQLCTAIGNFARNEPQAISAKYVLHPIRVVLQVMPSFCDVREEKVEVFAACCYALSNLFKIRNVISDASTRSSMAEWIAYALLHNINGDDPRGARFSDSLAYNAACAARNLMWMNEANVEVFVASSAHGDSGRGPPVVQLIESMRVFGMCGRWFVVEACLSALAMVLVYPRQRVRFMHRHGLKVFFEVLRWHRVQWSVVSLVFCMITTMFSEPATTANEKEAFWNAFVIDQGSRELVQSMSIAGRGGGSETERLEVLEQGVYAMLAVVRFDTSMRKSVIDAGGLVFVHRALGELSTNAAVGVLNVDKVVLTHKARVGTVLCDVMRELGADAGAYKYLRDNNVRRILEETLKLYSMDGTFARSCRGAIAMLGY